MVLQISIECDIDNSVIDDTTYTRFCDIARVETNFLNN